jgi:hypothetical protein
LSPTAAEKHFELKVDQNEWLNSYWLHVNEGNSLHNICSRKESMYASTHEFFRRVDFFRSV